MRIFNTTKIYAAFYYKKRDINSLQALFFRVPDVVTKVITLGRYSHCEIVTDRGECFECLN